VTLGVSRYDVRTAGIVIWSPPTYPRCALVTCSTIAARRSAAS